MHEDERGNIFILDYCKFREIIKFAEEALVERDGTQ